MHIYQYVTVFFVSAVLVHFYRLPAERVGLVDNPGGRKHHVGSVPLVGGIALFTAFVFVSLFLPIPLRPYSSLFLGMALLVIVGVLDDLSNLDPKAKLIAQIVAAVLMVSSGGIVITSLGDLFATGSIELEAWSFPFTILCVVGLINAINMIDGMDGLAGGVVLIMGGWLVVAALLNGSHHDATILTLLLCSVLGFMLFNYRHPWCNKAYVFMGDAGSMLLGFAIAWFAVKISQSGDGAVSPISIVWILSLPVFDTVSLMVRRVMKKQSPFAADREHLHHIFKKAGFSDAAAVNVLLLLVFLTGAIGFGGWYFNLPEPMLLLGLLLIFSAYLYFALHAWKTMRAIKRLHCWQRYRRNV